MPWPFPRGEFSHLSPWCKGGHWLGKSTIPPGRTCFCPYLALTPAWSLWWWLLTPSVLGCYLSANPCFRRLIIWVITTLSISVSHSLFQTENEMCHAGEFRSSFHSSDSRRGCFCQHLGLCLMTGSSVTPIVCWGGTAIPRAAPEPCFLVVQTKKHICKF